MQVLTWDGVLLALELPQTVDLEIVETAPGIKGASASSRNKPATLTTGLVVQVPEYLTTGEKIRIHIEESRYMGRADGLIIGNAPTGKKRQRWLSFLLSPLPPDLQQFRILGHFQRQLDAAHFRHPFETANRRIAWVGFLAQIVEHLMTMIRPKWDRAQIAGLFTPLLFAQDSIHHRHHIDVAAKVRRLVEGFWVCFTAGRAQMGKMDAIAEGLHHPHQIVIGANAIRSGTHGEAIINAVHRLLQPLHIFDGRHDTRQAEDRPRRIVRMHSQADPDLFRIPARWRAGNRPYFHAAAFLSISLVFRQTRAELVKGVALFRSRQAGDDIANQLIDIRFTRGIEIRQPDCCSSACSPLPLPGVSGYAARKPQKRSDRNAAPEPSGHYIFQIGTRPVEDRHKVVADGINTAGCQVTNALLIVRNPGLTLTGVGFDIFVNRNTFHNRPG